MEQFKKAKHIDIRGLTFINPEDIELFKHLKSFEVIIEDFREEIKLCNFQELQYCVIGWESVFSEISMIFGVYVSEGSTESFNHIRI
ncbi:hypothetical protein B9Z55_020198 [Caenorhabditis nigoni]|uniref:DUF38 domain-containing protein n=1 Tax=Caenorhabditis nigoni TaxID=1611254 RepID=A0A2G5TM62_9PELO|nr:hypothetical protein B9Z55_020198 [Caenorhabditis nigoni]